MFVALFLAFTTTIQTAAPDAAATVRRSGQQVIDAGYRSDVAALTSALTVLAPLIHTPEVAARAAYFSGFGHFQLALISGASDAQARMRHLDAAIRDLQIAVNLDGNDPEPALLLGHCYGMKRSFDPKGDYAIQLQATALRGRAITLAPANPRAVLVQAMSLYYRPVQAGGDRNKGLARWQEALDLFARTPSTEIAWGHAEGYIWLSQVHFNNGDIPQARAALEKSLTLRPDFVAAKTALASLPQ